MKEYFVRIGVQGEIHLASSLVAFSRGQRVVVRSNRGVAVGQVVSPRTKASGKSQTGNNPTGKDQNNSVAAQPPGFKILRPTTPSDELLLERLEKHKVEAIESCRARLRDIGSRATLLDVDQFLDGATLNMHFLGDLEIPAQRVVDEIAAHYEQQVRTDRLAELLTEGCGPDCGSGAACSSGCSSCSGCGVRR